LQEPRTEESAAEHTTNITDITSKPVPTGETVTHKSMARAGAARLAAMGAWLTTSRGESESPVSKPSRKCSAPGRCGRTERSAARRGKCSLSELVKLSGMRESEAMSQGGK
jgi:hypothetical protein